MKIVNFLMIAVLFFIILIVYLGSASVGIKNRYSQMNGFGPAVGTFISSDTAQMFISDFRTRFQDNGHFVESYFYGKDNIRRLLNQNNAAGLRIYNGYNENIGGKILVLVAANEDGRDITSNGLFLEFSMPCPPYCSPSDSTQTDSSESLNSKVSRIRGSSTIRIHDSWNKLLKKYVTENGEVNFEQLKAEKEVLNDYVQKLEFPQNSENWSRQKRLSYLLNMYNSTVMKLAIENYPESSKISNFPSNTRKDQKPIKLKGRRYSLEGFRRNILIDEFDDRRIHFTLYNASSSGPLIRNFAYTSDNIEVNLEKQTKEFINDPRYNSIKADEVQLAQIFQIYRQDFRNLINFLNAYSDVKINEDANVSYKELD